VLDPGQWFPGWNQGNAWRRSWPGTRGLEIPVSYTNRYGALIRGDVYGPLPHARDPYTGKTLRPPYPAVVVTTGSIQGSEKMYRWIAEDLAERGYVVLTYDVQGQGTSETFPHEGPIADFPYCDPTSKPNTDEQTGCPGVPFQQEANFVTGTEDAIDFIESTPRRPYPNPHRGSAHVDRFNPLAGWVDHRPDARTVTPGRTTKLAIIGHSLGAAAVSYVQGVDRRVEVAVALDKLSASGSFAQNEKVTPKVPSLGVQSEYGFNVEPYWTMGDSSFTPSPRPFDQGPDPKREEKTGFDAWRKAGVDSMVVVPRASTHLEYTDINWVLPASRYGQDVAGYYLQAWLDKYLKHRRSADRQLLARRFTYLEPRGGDKWVPVKLRRAKRLSFYFCSGYAFHSASGRLLHDTDIAGVGGC
jgi:dienelactone hydrolase